MMLQFAISNPSRGGRRKLPLAFTEHGAIMVRPEKSKHSYGFTIEEPNLDKPEPNRLVRINPYGKMKYNFFL